MNRIASRSVIALILVLALGAGMIFFVGEYAVKGKSWATFSGSPHVYNGGNIGCGTVTDRSGTLLLDMTDGWQYTDDTLLRESVMHWLGDREGNISAPAVASHAEEMVGYNMVNGVYRYGESQGNATLTLSADVQKTALEALGDYKGTVAVYNYKTGELLCAVTSPTYDPDDVPDLEEDDDRYSGVYLNRFTMASYIPGSIFKTVTLAAALEAVPDLQEHTYECDGVYSVGADEVTCESAHGYQTLEEAFANSCNCAFAQIAEELGGADLERYVRQFRITEPVSFDGITTAEGNFDISSGEQIDIDWSGIGQHLDQINPCRFLTYMGAIASGGEGVEPYLVSEIRVGGSRTYAARKQSTGRLMTAATAATMQAYMRNNVESNYGADNFPGLTVCAKSGTGEVGGDRRPNAMFCGFVTDDAYPLAFIASVEDAGYGSSVCVPILSQVLLACKDMMDAF